MFRRILSRVWLIDVFWILNNFIKHYPETYENALIFHFIRKEQNF